MTPLVRDAIELLVVVALGGMLWSAVGRLRRGHVAVPRCTNCDRPASRAYNHCPRCGAQLWPGAPST